MEWSLCDRTSTVGCGLFTYLQWRSSPKNLYSLDLLFFFLYSPPPFGCQAGPPSSFVTTCCSVCMAYYSRGSSLRSGSSHPCNTVVNNISGAACPPTVLIGSLIDSLAFFVRPCHLIDSLIQNFFLFQFLLFCANIQSRVARCNGRTMTSAPPARR